MLRVDFLSHLDAFWFILTVWLYLLFSWYYPRECLNVSDLSSIKSLYVSFKKTYMADFLIVFRAQFNLWHQTFILLRNSILEKVSLFDLSDHPLL